MIRLCVCGCDNGCGCGSRTYKMISWSDLFSWLDRWFDGCLVAWLVDVTFVGVVVTCFAVNVEQGRKASGYWLAQVISDGIVVFLYGVGHGCSWWVEWVLDPWVWKLQQMMRWLTTPPKAQDNQWWKGWLTFIGNGSTGASQSSHHSLQLSHTQSRAYTLKMHCKYGALNGYKSQLCLPIGDWGNAWGDCWDERALILVKHPCIRTWTWVDCIPSFPCDWFHQG